MTDRELDAAGIRDPELREAYRRCRRLNARHGRTYFLATRLLPVERRPAVHALYGFARWADDIVDDLHSAASPAQRAAALDELDARLRAGLAGQPTDEPVVRALADTAARYDIAHEHFTDFMASMRSDLVVTGYPTYDDLRAYMHGSAAVIGLQMLPVLGTVVPRAQAAPQAAALGVAFQLTNFLRDVGEDLDRGRVYLPQDLLAAHGVDRDLLAWSRLTGLPDPRITTALRNVAELTRAVYREAAPGIAQLDPVSRPCVRTAFVLYGAILDAVADDGYRVLHRRAVVSRRRRATVALDGLVRTAAARIRPTGTGRRGVTEGEHGGAATNARPSAHDGQPRKETV
ncbi:phytoene synthase [Streptomyces spiroverticillatus]|uniref:Phytoene synthase n=1 Tax=Streptomyces finlayi TaxID=67296 RepID=A0A919CG95_9ACTN|nr:phytoene/squalene synthase family protein [Streptomyces finlayi]GHA44824.1 phytoene synthase [Streptomyces spiroverticillatus]GHD18023.1 phytoene synthase [Streptomyces finlayi]